MLEHWLLHSVKCRVAKTRFAKLVDDELQAPKDENLALGEGEMRLR